MQGERKCRRWFRVQLEGAAEGRFLAGPYGPLSVYAEDLRPLAGVIEHLGDGLIRLDEEACRALRLLPWHADGRISDSGKIPVMIFGAAHSLVKPESAAE